MGEMIPNQLHRSVADLDARDGLGRPRRAGRLLRGGWIRTIAGALTLALSVSSVGITSPSDAWAQKGKKEEGKGKPQEINLDDDEPSAATAGQMTEEHAQGKRLFDNEQWAEAAVILKRVVDGDTGDDQGNKEIAEYHYAIALYRLQFFQASYAIFATISEKRTHLKFQETLLWLAKLATQLPEPANIVERVGKYTAEEVARFDNPQQRDLYWQLNYMLGRYKYRNELTDQAIELFEKVDRKSRHFVHAQFFLGISNVKLRKSVPAVQAFQRIVTALDEGVEGVEEPQRMRDLANLSMARTYYSASVRADENNVPTIDAQKLNLAIRFWNKVDVSSDYWLDAIFEQTWAYFMAGDYPHALGNIHTLESPYFPKAFYAEASVLKALVAFTVCQYDDAMTVISRVRVKYDPIKTELKQVLKRFKGENQDQQFFDFLKQVREGKAELSAAVKPIVDTALSDRQLLRSLEYVRVIDDEEARLKKAPADFRDSPVGGDVVDALSLAKGLVVTQTGKLARARFERQLAELEEQLKNAQKLSIDITSGERTRLDEEALKGKLSAEDAKTYGRVDPDDEHVLWPFDGEYWRDELGFYRQVVVSKCAGGAGK